MGLPTYENIDPDLIAFLGEHFKVGDSRCYQALPLSSALQERRKISRQAASALLGRLVDSGVLVAEEKSRPKKYRLDTQVVFAKNYQLKSLEEHLVWAEDLMPILEKYASKESLKIWEYGITEMINNAIDHSEGTTLSVVLTVSAVYAGCTIADDGEGIFRRITRLCNLRDERQAILELSKGKLTTDPKRHSGEGLFFTSRAMEWFSLDSYGLFFNHADGDGDKDWLFDVDHTMAGSRVMMDLNHNTQHNLRNLFDQFAAPDSYSFNKTIVPVRLAKIGAESLVSRSQANRLLARVDSFETVIFDFSEIESIGQAFADEIFRVFKREHPEVNLGVQNTNPEIDFMIQRALAHK